MNTPTGFQLSGGVPVEIDPLAVMSNPHALHQSLHMVLAAFAATGFLVAGIHAFLLLRSTPKPFHEQALGIALVVGAIPALLQPVSGDVLAKAVAEFQPAKLAAMEALFHTERGAAFRLGGLPDEDTQTVRYALDVPKALSLILYMDPDAVVMGLDRIPRRDWPPVAVVHIAFQIMVGAGVIMAALALWAGWRWWRRQAVAEDVWLLRCLVLAAPLGMLAIEMGWTVTEVGRQPWIIFGVMRTADAVTPMPGIAVPFVLFTILYVLLSGVVVWTLWRHVAATGQMKEKS